MEDKELLLLDMLSLVNEEMDIDAIEERLVNIVSEVFSFDRVGLFFVKHHKEILQGKLCKGFEPGTISSIEIPVAEEFPFTRPLVMGIPLRGSEIEGGCLHPEDGTDEFRYYSAYQPKKDLLLAAKELPDYRLPGLRKTRVAVLVGAKCQVLRQE